MSAARVGQIAASIEASGIEAAGVPGGALFYSISPSEFDRWLAKAAPGARITYAHGVIDRMRDVLLAARAAAQAGEVDLFQPRNGRGGFDYIARRVAPGGAGREGQQAPASSDLGRDLPPLDPASDAGRVLAMLAAFADWTKPCPTNRDIAVRLRLNDARRVRYLVQRLAQQGHIIVENRGARVTRVVTIAATGARTSDARTPVGGGFAAEGEA